MSQHSKSEARYYELVDALDAIDVVKAFALEMSTDSTVLLPICAQLTTKRPEAKGKSHEESIVGHLLEILIEPICLEVVATVISRTEFKFHVYPFGINRPTSAFSIDCFSTNPTLSACFWRSITSGVQRSGVRFFTKQESPPDRSRIIYSGFQWNEIFSAHFLRSSMLLNFVACLASGIDLCFADQYPHIEIAMRAEILLNRVVNQVESRLAQHKHIRGASMPWVNERLLCAVNDLRNGEKSPQSAKRLFAYYTLSNLAALDGKELVQH